MLSSLGRCAPRLRAASLLLGAWLGLGALPACSGSGDDEQVASAGPIPCEVQMALERACLRCHGRVREYGAPYSFTSLDRIREVRGSKPVFERMQLAIEEDFMPPVSIDVEPPVRPLLPEDERVLLDWLSQGAPSGPRCQ